MKKSDNVTGISRGNGNGSNGGGSNIDECLTRIETKLEYIATKEDIQKIKVWLLSGILGGMGMAAVLAMAF